MYMYIHCSVQHAPAILLILSFLPSVRPSSTSLQLGQDMGRKVRWPHPLVEDTLHRQVKRSVSHCKPPLYVYMCVYVHVPSSLPPSLPPSLPLSFPPSLPPSLPSSLPPSLPTSLPSSSTGAPHSSAAHSRELSPTDHLKGSRNGC